LRFLLRLRLVRSASNVLLTWVRPSFCGFWLVLQRITLTRGKRSILLLRLQRIALTYRIQLLLQRRIGILLGLLRSYLRLHSRNLLGCLRRYRNGYCRDEKTGSHQGSD
jgi:hypothetical protein